MKKILFIVPVLFLQIFTASAQTLSTSTASTSTSTISTSTYIRVLIPEGLRKEEIAKIFTKSLNWDKKQEKNFLSFNEGTYFPETYLIPPNEVATKTAQRLISKFNEQLGPYLPLFNEQNVKWTTALTLASIVQREAANSQDMPIVAGILWNRLNQKMQLNADATLQYLRGDTGNGYWAQVSVKDKKIKSPYNTYKNKGLPPHPISNPGISAIEAVLNPATTTCLYYLHDKDHIIHCANTYDEHLQNIETYLK